MELLMYLQDIKSSLSLTGQNNKRNMSSNRLNLLTKTTWKILAFQVLVEVCPDGDLWICGEPLDFAQIFVVRPIAWFAWAGLISLGGLPDLPEQDWSVWNGLPDLPEQDWSVWEGCLICLSRIHDPAQANQAIRQTTKFSEKSKLRWCS